jgi:heme/copper-type cytochrome/quinol oxidase subunit 2
MEQPQMQPRPTSSEVSFGEWFLTIFLAAIPLVGLVLLFVWAFSASTNPSKANWAKATLAWAAIGIVIYLIIFVVIMGIMGTAANY